MLTDFQHLFVVEAALGEIVTRHADTDDELRADPFAYRVDHAHPEPQPIVEATAVFVVAVVHIERPELVDQMTMARHDLAAVEPARLKAARGGGEGLDEFLDHRFVERMRVFAVIRFSHVARRVHAIPEVDAAPAAPRCVIWQITGTSY